jgi:energy-converting hydrogenase Eha subunit B
MMRHAGQAVLTLLAAPLLASIAPGGAPATVIVGIPDRLCADPGATDIDVPIELTNDTPPTGTSRRG